MNTERAAYFTRRALSTGVAFTFHHAPKFHPLQSNREATLGRGPQRALAAFDGAGQEHRFAAAWSK
jgi:hypothetical protein